MKGKTAIKDRIAHLRKNQETYKAKLAALPDDRTDEQQFEHDTFTETIRMHKHSINALEWVLEK